MRQRLGVLARAAASVSRSTGSVRGSLRSTIVENRLITYRFNSTARTPVPDGNDKDSLKVISKPRDEQKLAVRELARISQKRLLGSHAPY